MQEALKEARACIPQGDVPVGCVIVSPEGDIIGRGRNRREAEGRATAHAEVEAINMACAAVGSWRLTGCTLYVTLEPCPMCTGAIINAHVDRVVYGADDERAGCCGTAADLFALPYSHRPELYRGFFEAEAKALLRAFFQALRA